jgi:GAF domain-containing protein
VLEPIALSCTDKAPAYEGLCEQLVALLEGEDDALACLANAAALIFHGLCDLNWAGFYLLRGEQLVLGPFQGKPACTRIAINKGVCGAAVARRASLLVPDVHAFPGHIACDMASLSELVVPLVEGDAVLGVLDLDSPVHGRFDGDDQAGVELFVAALLRQIGRRGSARERLARASLWCAPSEVSTPLA